MNFDALFAFGFTMLFGAIAFGLPSILFGWRNDRGHMSNFIWGIVAGPIGWFVVAGQKPKETPYHVLANKRIESIRRGDT